MNFIHDNFLLRNKTAQTLYHDYAENMPIFDYHCHIPPQQVADDVQFETITQIWLYGDHYKWRAMRSNGVSERFCTGDASDCEKFEQWAHTVPHTLRNPLYHWTHLELKRYFGIDDLLGPDTCCQIYDHCNQMLNTPDFSTRNILRRSNVKAICTTDDPLDSLEYHAKIKNDHFEIKVLPTWRPDKAMATNNIPGLNRWIDNLADLAAIDITDFNRYLEAIQLRHDFFHAHGCRLSDHGLDTAYAEDYNANDIESIFQSIRKNQTLSILQHRQFRSAMLYEFGKMDHARAWTQQYHIGALRNNNTRLYQELGPDTGFDSIGDLEIALPLSKMLDRLDQTNQLAKTILYNLNPRDNELLATMIGNFQDGSCPGKMQYGSGWWFLDQKDGMINQINTLSNLGLLSRFVGMLTDSRSFLSYPRHEYFRRILCNIIGNDVENGELPSDINLLGAMVQNICFNNARNYFGIEI